jgi:acyl-CoA synthetase (AMP-forming)/AMP-acid ligase II
MFWVAFYGCLLAEVIPVPIEVPLSRQVRVKDVECFIVTSLVGYVAQSHVIFLIPDK